MVIAPFLEDDVKTRAFIAGLAQNFDSLAETHSQKADEFVKKSFTKQVEDMVRYMPQQELATLAESLIEITSLKRTVTKERETVGGDVDVAVITKAEGLVWVKRKHYFPPELNTRYFNRQHRRGSLK